MIWPLGYQLWLWCINGEGRTIVNVKRFSLGNTEKKNSILALPSKMSNKKRNVIFFFWTLFSGFLFQVALNVVFFFGHKTMPKLLNDGWTERNGFDLWVWGDKDEAYRGRVQQYLTRSNQCQHYQIHHCRVKQYGRKEKKELFFFFYAMFNTFLRRKLNPKLQECMISTLVGHSGFELWYSEKDWSNGADSMNAIEVKRFVKKKKLENKTAV